MEGLLHVLNELHLLGWAHLDVEPKHFGRAGDGSLHFYDLDCARRIGSVEDEGPPLSHFRWRGTSSLNA